MRTERKILAAFILNLSFSVFEFVGGVATGSIAILSDALHDLGDAAGIGISWILERKSTQAPDERHTYGYGRYSVLGSFITTVILMIGSAAMICNALRRFVQPIWINYDGMILFAVVGVCVNFCAAYFTRGGESLNQRAVNLHMLEDVLGWGVVLAGAFVMRMTNLAVLDPVMSIGVSCFILINALKNLREILDIFLEKVPCGIEIEEITQHLRDIDGVIDVHHLHLWSMDGRNHCATMHIVADGETHDIKEKIREELREHGIGHATLELETRGEVCREKVCRTEVCASASHGHHHHH